MGRAREWRRDIENGRGVPCPEPPRGEGQRDVSGTAISCFSIVFHSFRWWPPLGFRFLLVEGGAAWRAAPTSNPHQLCTRFPTAPQAQPAAACLSVQPLPRWPRGRPLSQEVNTIELSSIRSIQYFSTRGNGLFWKKKKKERPLQGR